MAWTIWWGFVTVTANLNNETEHWRYIFGAFTLIGFIICVIGYWYGKFNNDDCALIRIGPKDNNND